MIMINCACTEQHEPTLPALQGSRHPVKLKNFQEYPVLVMLFFPANFHESACAADLPIQNEKNLGKHYFDFRSRIYQI